MPTIQPGDTEPIIMERQSHPIESPDELKQYYHLSPQAIEQVRAMRTESRGVLAGQDSRLIVVDGGCSLDGSGAALEYALRRQDFSLANGLDAKLVERKRVPPSKPRSRGGDWRGAEDDSILEARRDLVEMRNLGLSVTLEILEPVHFERYGDLIDLSWFGARNNLDGSLREAATMYSNIPLMVKNSINGSIGDAVDTMAAAAMRIPNARFVAGDGRQHRAVGVSPGTEPGAIILRGSNLGHNLTAEAIFQAVELMEKAGISNRGVMLDTSHGNSAAFSGGKKTPEGQVLAVEHIIGLLRQSDLRPHIRGVMIEANLVAGTGLEYGQSRTDPGVDIQTLHDLLLRLAEAA